MIVELSATVLFYLSAGYLTMAGVTALAIAAITRTFSHRLLFGACGVFGIAGAVAQLSLFRYHTTDSAAVAARAMLIGLDASAIAWVALAVLLCLYGGIISQWRRLLGAAAVAALTLLLASHSAPPPLTSERLLLAGLGDFTPGVWRSSAGWNMAFWYGCIAIIGIAAALAIWRQRLQLSQRRSALLWSVLAATAGSLGLGFVTDFWQLPTLYWQGFAFAYGALCLTVSLARQEAAKGHQLLLREREMQSEILQRKLAEQSLERLSQVFMQAPAATHIVDLEGRVLQVNDESVRLFKRDLSQAPHFDFFSTFSAMGATRDELLGKLEAGISPDIGPFLFGAGCPVGDVYLVRDAWLKFKLFPIFNEAGSLRELVARVEDVTEKQFVESAISTISQAVSAGAGHAFFKQIVVYLARLLQKRYVFIGLKDERDGEPYIRSLAAAENGELRAALDFPLHGTPSEQLLLEGRLSVPRQVQLRYPNQALLQELNIESYLGAAIFDQEQNAVGVLVVLDVKPMQYIEQMQELLNIFASRAGIELDRLQTEARIRQMAYQDPITGLPNRLQISEELDALLRGHSSGVFFQIDLDHFKTINDALGHDVGDEVLRCLGRRLALTAAPDRLVARLGGDEFAVVQGGEASAQVASRLALEISALFARPVQVGDHLLDVGCTLGSVTFPDAADTAIEIFRSADIALYRAKTAGRGSHQVFTPAMRVAVSERLEMEKGLRNALHNKQLALVYQPQINSVGEVIGAEALLRWHHPERGNIPPSSFIPLAEESGLINALGQWVLTEALRQRRDWRDAGVPFGGHLSVNVSAWQFARPDFVDTVMQTLAELDVPAAGLTLEVTETAILGDIEDTVGKLSALRRRGITIALDDFGTGYSSLAYLRDLPIDWLKIDKTFVDALQVSADEPLVESMISIGRHMGLKVLAEGVETAIQLERLQSLGCHMYQGYYFARPLDPAAFAQWLQNPTRVHAPVLGPRQQHMFAERETYLAPASGQSG